MVCHVCLGVTFALQLARPYQVWAGSWDTPNQVRQTGSGAATQLQGPPNNKWLYCALNQHENWEATQTGGILFVFACVLGCWIKQNELAAFWIARGSDCRYFRWVKHILTPTASGFASNLFTFKKEFKAIWSGITAVQDNFSTCLYWVKT